MEWRVREHGYGYGKGCGKGKGKGGGKGTEKSKGKGKGYAWNVSMVKKYRLCYKCGILHVSSECEAPY